MSKTKINTKKLTDWFWNLVVNN